MTPETLTYPLPIDRVEVQTIKLISPLLRIGGAVQSLSPFEYVQSGNRVYIPHSDLLARQLYQRGRLNDYLDRIKNRQEIGTLLKQVFGDDWAGLKSSDGRSIFPTQLQKWTDDRITEFRPMIRNGMGQLYIPGSSIKGAMRTAITYHLLKHKNLFKTPKSLQTSELERKIRDKLVIKEGEKPKWRVKLDKLDDEMLINPLFSNFTITNRDRAFTGKRGEESNTDFMRAVKISDSAPLIPEQANNIAVAGKVIVSSYFEDYKFKYKYKSPIYAEMVSNVNTTFTITLDRELLSWFKHKYDMKIPFESIEDILKICQEFTQDRWYEEHDYWNAITNNSSQNHQLDFDDIRELYEPKDCLYKLRLGWGTGMNGTTISSGLPDDLRQDIRDCGIPAPGFDAPKSRRTVANNDGEVKHALGWTKLELINK